MQILYILTYTFTLSLFVFGNHCFLLESSGYQQLEGNMFCPGAVGLLLSHSGLHMQYMILSQLNVWCFLRGDKREDIVCSMWDCRLVPEEQASDAKIDWNHQIYFKHLIWGGNGCSSKNQMAADRFEPSKCQLCEKHLNKYIIALFQCSCCNVHFSLSFM